MWLVAGCLQKQGPSNRGSEPCFGICCRRTPPPPTVAAPPDRTGDSARTRPHRPKKGAVLRDHFARSSFVFLVSLVVCFRPHATTKGTKTTKRIMASASDPAAGRGCFQSEPRYASPESGRTQERPKRWLSKKAPGTEIMNCPEACSQAKGSKLMNKPFQFGRARWRSFAASV